MSEKTFIKIFIIIGCVILLMLGKSYMDVQAADCIDADCDGSGAIDIDDIVLYINYIFAGETGSPCKPCTDVLEVGKSYIVYDTLYERSGVFAVGDSLFSYLHRWVLQDSIHIISIQNIRRTNLNGWMISDTAYLAAVEYYLGLPDSGGVTGGWFIGGGN